MAQTATWAERVGSLASKVGTTAGKVGVGTVATVKAAPYVYGAGDVGYRVMTGEGVDEAVVNTAGDIAKLGAKAAGWGLEQFLKASILKTMDMACKTSQKHDLGRVNSYFFGSN